MKLSRHRSPAPQGSRNFGGYTMKLVKSLLLGSAAGLAAVAGANAADLPAKKAVAAVEYVRVCSTYGAGFFYIPGTETCLRVGGRARADYLLRSSPSDRASGRDRLPRSRPYPARRSHGHGLRPAAHLRSLRDHPELGQPFGHDRHVRRLRPNVAQAFVQFGGLTAGRSTSFFDNPDLPTEHFGTLRFSDAPDVACSGLHLLVRQRLLGHPRRSKTV